MATRFEGQVALVTGGADGLGKSIAERLASEGATVYIADCNEEKLGATLAEMTGKGLSVFQLVLDVSDEESVSNAVDAVVANKGQLDIMVNCAGIVGPNGVKTEDVTVDAFEKVMAVNVRGSFLMTKHCLRVMVPRKYGRILLVASIAGKEGNAGMCAYSTSKAAVIGLTKSAGKEHAESGVTVNALAPAVIRTAMVEGMEPAQVKYMTDKIPMKRCGTLEEVASLMSWIVSKEASFNTGFCFDLTGGRAVY
eukprot:m.138836 g.138836  ORF g.138836 m.138836 type:complete len:252 (-) comp14014_c0_seq8:185-940(-)